MHMHRPGTPQARIAEQSSFLRHVHMSVPRISSPLPSTCVCVCTLASVVCVRMLVQRTHVHEYVCVLAHTDFHRVRRASHSLQWPSGISTMLLARWKHTSWSSCVEPWPGGIATQENERLVSGNVSLHACTSFAAFCASSAKGRPVPLTEAVRCKPAAPAEQCTLK